MSPGAKRRMFQTAIREELIYACWSTVMAFAASSCWNPGQHTGQKRLPSTAAEKAAQVDTRRCEFQDQRSGDSRLILPLRPVSNALAW